jgi:hypothetical protein
VNTQRQLEQFVDTIAHVLRYFQERLGGEFATLTRIRAEMAGSGVISVIK